MSDRTHRITLIARDAFKQGPDWSRQVHGRRNVTFCDSLGTLRETLRTAVDESGLDVGRVIIDRAGTADHFLDLLAELPDDFNGDLLFIRDSGCGVLSASTRGSGRVLYPLTVNDVHFYLEANDLIAGPMALLGRTA